VGKVKRRQALCVTQRNPLLVDVHASGLSRQSWRTAACRSRKALLITEA
jgi:hypothetical protein